MIELDGLKVGLFGINTLPLRGQRQAAKALGITVADPLGTTQGTTAVLREKGAQVVIGLFHLAEGPDHARELARAVSRASTCSCWATPGASATSASAAAGSTSPSMEADRQGRLVGKLDIYANDKVVYRQEYHRLDTSYVSDEKMQALRPALRRREQAAGGPQAPGGARPTARAARASWPAPPTRSGPTPAPPPARSATRRPRSTS